MLVTGPLLGPGRVLVTGPFLGPGRVLVTGLVHFEGLGRC